jgi:hypothetical protein
MALHPIETHYNGYHFRSRLEARWAVCFEVLGIAYHYEPEGYDIDGTAYLPDFSLPQIGCFAEVKPTTFTSHEFTLAVALGRTLLLDGMPEVKLYSCGTLCGACEAYSAHLLATHPLCARMPRARHGGALAYDCYRKGHAYNRVNLLASRCKGSLWYNWGEGLDDRAENEAFQKAVLAARSARFEYGESGARGFAPLRSTLSTRVSTTLRRTL